jgi:conjugative relaxase-like TrwC/TraI family protein
MLSHKILKRKDISRTTSYYADSADDYYVKEGDVCEWQGKGAEILGLHGAVDKKKFHELLSGKVAGKSTRPATRKDSEERIGIDFTFSAPKSVSMQSLISDDAEIIKAHDKAVQRAIEIAETRAQARQKINGKSRVETTGNLIVAKFRHETSREQDPQLHTHCAIMNLTCRKDGKWRALKNDEIIKTTRYLGAVYRAELAAELTKLGYQLRHERDGLFELAHISREQLEEFSLRSAQIEKKLAEEGLTRETASKSKKQLVTLQTRKRKVSIEREKLFNRWRDRAKSLNINFNHHNFKYEIDKDLKSVREILPEYAASEAAKRSVKFAIHHLTERQAVVDERVLLDTALKHAVGSACLSDIEQEIKNFVEQGYLIKEAPLYLPADEIRSQKPGRTRQAWIAELTEKNIHKKRARERVDAAIANGGLMPLELRYTTQTALDREKSILKIEREGRDVLLPIMPAEMAQKHFASTNLNEGQRASAELILTTKNRVVGVQGFAGTGKSHMLKVVKATIEEQGYNMRALAPYGSQVKALRELGIESNTLASFLHAKDKKINEQTILVVDEAGVVPARLMNQTLKLAEKAGVHVVLLGDTEQTKAIEAGPAFSQLQLAGMQTAHMNEIKRQEKNPILKEAVEFAAKGETSKSIQRITSISEIKEDLDRYASMAKYYIQLPESERNQTLIVSGTNEARRKINHMVRSGLGRSGNGFEFDTLIRRDTTQAERRFSKHYRIGDLIQPEKDYIRSGLKRGQLYKVKETGPGNRLTVLTESGENITFNPMAYKKISVYQPERSEFSVGDVVRITRNDAALDLANGDRMKVTELQEGNIILTNGKRSVTLPTEKPLHIDHSYATTVHSTQGATDKRILIDIETSSLTTAKDVYYVAISRATKEARIYTNNAKELPVAIARENIKLAAFDIVREKNREMEKMNHHKKSQLNFTKISQIQKIDSEKSRG